MRSDRRRLSLLALAILGACAAAVELTEDGKPMPISMAEVVAGRSRQGTTIGQPLQPGVGEESAADSNIVTLPVEREAFRDMNLSFVYVNAYRSGLGTRPLRMLHGFIDGRAWAVDQLDELRIYPGTPIGIYSDVHNEADTRRYGFRRHLVVYDTKRANVYLAADHNLICAVIHVDSPAALELLPEYVGPLPAAIKKIEELESLHAALVAAEGLRRGVDAPVPAAVLELKQRLEAKVAAQAQAAAAKAKADAAAAETFWASRNTGTFAERLAAFWELKQLPESMEVARRASPELAQFARTEAEKSPLPERYVLTQIADNVPNILFDSVEQAFAQARRFDAECIERGEQMIQSMTLHRPSDSPPPDPTIQAMHGHLFARIIERVDAQAGSPAQRAVRVAERIVRMAGGFPPPQQGQDWLVGKIEGMWYSDVQYRASCLIELKADGAIRGTTLGTFYNETVLPRLIPELVREMCAQAVALIEQGRPAAACVRYVQAGLLTHPDRVPQVVMSLTQAAADTDPSPFASARRAAVRALAQFEPPLSAGMPHSFRFAERLAQPPFSERMMGYVLGLLPEGPDDLRLACKQLGIELGFLDVRETATGLELVAVDQAPNANPLADFDAWASNHFPVTTDLRGLSEELAKEKAWMDTEFAALAAAKAAMDAEDARLAQEKAHMATLGPEQHNAMVAAHNAAIARANQTATDFNRRNDAYTVRKTSFNAKVPGYNARLVGERWGKVLEFRAKIDAAIVAWHDARLKALPPDEASATKWLAASGLQSGGPNLGQPQVRPPRQLVERELAWMAEDAFKHVEDKQIIDTLSAFMVKTLWISTTPQQRVERLRPLLLRLVAQRDGAAAKQLIETHWGHYNEREAVLRIVEEATKPKVTR